ncbi:MAG TPA: hypothetical protein VHB25_07120 [Gemmatimonadaceae bacterium]|nr:hypothetical protein [Gemmatimonadaceae bacterium]
MSPSVLWPALLGSAVLVAGILSYRRELRASGSYGLAALGPAFVAASLAAFAGEHFTAAASLAQLVPKWLPGRLFIAYFVGAAHLAAAVSIVAKRYVRWSALCLFAMFALFVLLMDLPGAVAQPASRMAWILAARETTFAVGALALFAFTVRVQSPLFARQLATVARLWTAGVLVYYGVDHLLHPQLSPGVPSTAPTAGWVPAPHLLAYAVGALLVALGVATFIEHVASAAAAIGGALMTALTVVLYVPQFLRAGTAAAQVVGINFIFDTLLFAGTLLVIGRTIRATAPVGVEAAGVPAVEYQPS